MKILAIASAGGHWIQLLRLIPAFKDHELIFMSTKTEFADTVKEYKFYAVPDANRKNKFNLLFMALEVVKMVFSIKPDVIITTGAAPGLMGLLGGRLIGAKTIWVDSIANVETLSLSGKLAKRVANRVYTQWPDLAIKGVIYKGNVLS